MLSLEEEVETNVAPVIKERPKTGNTYSPGSYAHKTAIRRAACKRAMQELVELGRDDLTDTLTVLKGIVEGRSIRRKEIKKSRKKRERRENKTEVFLKRVFGDEYKEGDKLYIEDVYRRLPTLFNAVSSDMSTFLRLVRTGVLGYIDSPSGKMLYFTGYREKHNDLKGGR